MTQSPASGQSTSTKTILIGAFGCVLAVFMIGMIILGIVGFRMLSGDGFDISNIVNRSSDDVYIEEEGSPLDLLGSEKFASFNCAIIRPISASSPHVYGYDGHAAAQQRPRPMTVIVPRKSWPCNGVPAR